MAPEASVPLAARHAEYGSVAFSQTKPESSSSLASVLLFAPLAVLFLAAADFFPALSPWSGAVYSILFLVAGVVLSRAPPTPNLLITCFSRIAPSYFFGLLLALLRLPVNAAQTLRRLAVASFFLQAWIPSSNDLNPPAWCIGPALLCLAVFPTAKALMSPLQRTTKTIIIPILLCFVIWAAYAESRPSPAPGRQLVYYTFNYIPFRAYLPVFLLGMAIGLHDLRIQMSRRIVRYTVTALCTVLIALVTLTSPPDTIPHSFAALLTFPLVLPIVFLSTSANQPAALLLVRVQKLLSPIAVPLLLLHSPIRALIIPPASHGNSICNFFPKGTQLWGTFTWCSPEVPLGLLASTLAACIAILLITSFRFLLDRPARLVIRARLVQIVEQAHQRTESVPTPDSTAKKLFVFYSAATVYFLLFFSVAAGGLDQLAAFRNRPIPLVSPLVDTVSAPVIALLGVSFCTLLVNVVAHFRFAESILKTQPASLMNSKPRPMNATTFPYKLYFRIVTRGSNPHLVRKTVASAFDALKVANSLLPENQAVVEVVTDRVLHMPDHFDSSVSEIVVPDSFTCLSGAKFKARALHYAIEASEASENDWIVHLDEESRFDVTTVQAIVSHLEVSWADAKSRPVVAQGPVMYVHPGQKDDRVDVNWLTTLGDSFRVGDDFGKYRMQYHYGKPWLGMHGSFVVCPNSLEKSVGFDHGMAGSITEDAYFAILASTRGAHFTWLDAFMYEQSPFTVKDVVKQRSRWLGGLILVCGASELPLRSRLVLCVATLFWLCLPLQWLAIVGLSALRASIMSTPAVVVMTSLSWTMVTWCYMIGFIKTFQVQDGVARFVSLMYLQFLLQPIHGLIEAAAVVYTAVHFRSVSSSFHVVQKETNQRNPNALKAEVALAV